MNKMEEKTASGENSQEAENAAIKINYVSSLVNKFESSSSRSDQRASKSVRLSRHRFPSSNRNPNSSFDSKELINLKKQLDTLALEVKPSYLNNREDRVDGIPAKPSRSKTPSQSGHWDCKHLITAAREGNLEVVQWLIKKRVNPNAIDSKGRSALLIAASFDKLGTFRYLLQVCDTLQTDDNGWNALHVGAVAGHLRIVEECVTLIPLDLRSSGGLTPLCLAVNRGHLNVVEYLLKKGAAVDIGCKKLWNVLHFAARGRHSLILYVLLTIYGSKCRELVNKQNMDGMTPVALAVIANSMDCVRQLLDFGADPDIADNRGWRPARLAAINNYRGISQYLARYKAEM